jgi:hypothetical protein
MIKDPTELKIGQRLHWTNGDTATVEHQTWGAAVVRWNNGTVRVYPHDDQVWNHFKIYAKTN